MEDRRGVLGLARLFIAVVLAWNVQCALVFVIAPDAYAAGFELAGAPGSAAVRGMGVLFLMWNVPYAVALSHPLRRRVSLYEALAMQTIGLLGESFILLSLPVVHSVARASIARFIAFDGAGVVLLALAVALVRRELAQRR
ncbi:MAG: hypothetical protein BWY52_01550 [Chloroflexi bacterium ADurb.Bin325]|nr:MAG: hypothetical protein BWY52_01550 [Chloroflexi bacterium ADurb.Bin325]